MSPSNGCPSDRSNLMSLLKGSATEELRVHVDGCARCRLEMLELRGTLELVAPAEETRPSERVRRQTLSYAQAQMGGSNRRRAAWRAPTTAIFGAGLAVLFGGLAEARSAPAAASATEIFSPEPWTLVLGAAWGLALLLYTLQSDSALRSTAVARAMVGGASFLALVLVLPVPAAVELYATRIVGVDQLLLDQAIWAYAGLAGLYAVVASALASRIQRGAHSSWYEGCRAALLFVGMAAPVLLIQAAAAPLLVSVAGVAGMGCGASLGARLAGRIL